MRDGAGCRVPGHSPLGVEPALMRGSSPWKGVFLVAHPVVVARHLLCQENLSQALLDVANLRSGSTLGGGGVVFWVSHLPAPGQVSDEASVEVGWRSRACVFLTLCFLSGTGWVGALLPLALEWTRVLPPSQQVGNRGGGRPTGTWGGPEGPRSLESRQRLGPGCLPFPGNRAPFLD